MKNKIDHIEIKNFKSLKSVSFDCKRINLFVGKPNTGKSNLLEAISLYGACMTSYSDNKFFLSEYIRFNNFNDLFFDHIVGEPIHIKSNIGTAILRYHDNINYYDLIISTDNNILKKLPSNIALQLVEKAFDKIYENIEPVNGSLTSIYYQINKAGYLGHYSSSIGFSPIKKYEFKHQKDFPRRWHLFLSPPFGDNLYTIADKNKAIHDYIVKIFKEYKLKFLFKGEETKFDVQKQIKGKAYSFEYNLVADTIQRMFFYYAAIFSNKDSVLLFEEPEVHAFPPYVTELAQLIIERKENQYFIVTHSPFLLNTIIENTPSKDVAVFNVKYENWKTQVTPYTEKEISHILNYGIDIFDKIK
jgi:AAA15 family ATPase/GTPase